ncbi:hypothetical protein BDV18DRAFT_147752 [Aspergillus unguis]
MPAPTEANGENRRPRRSSITQQLHRMFHKDKADDTKKSVYENSLSDRTSPSMRRADSSSFDYANYGPSEVSSPGYSRNSHSSFNSKITGMNTLESRHSSIQSFQLEPSQPTEHPILDGPLKPESDKPTTVSHGLVQKKDRRATKRLEAERLELEKRMLKLEEAERANDSSPLRRESRRLTKKQPLDSVSRSSSASGDESRSRPPSRLSSIFSRRRSRSRTSSTDGFDDSSHEVTPSTNPNPLLTLSSTLPEQLSTAISKELAARKNALLVSPVESSLSLGAAHTRNGPDYAFPGQSTIRDEASYYATGAITDHDIQTVYNVEDHARTPEDNTSSTNTYQQGDLDRTLFTASLSSKRKSAVPPSKQSPKTAKPEHNKPGSDPGHSEAQSLVGEDHNGMGPRHRSKSPRKGLPRSMLARASTDGVMERHQKKFISSPLAVSQTIVGDDAPSAPRRASTLASLQTDTARSQVLAALVTRSESNVTNSPAMQQTSHGDMQGRKVENASSRLTVPTSMTEARNARSMPSSVPATSQLAPQAMLMKPRFYHSLNKVTGPNGRTPEATGTLPFQRQDRDSSPIVPPRSPKRHSRTGSQTSALKPNPELESAGSFAVASSPGSDTDYDTADETTSIMSRISDDGDGPTTDTDPITDAAPSKRGPQFDNVVRPMASSPKAESKKTTKKTKETKSNRLVAKRFVICCHCKHWHDMPSDVYASLTVSDPLSVALDQELAVWEQDTMNDRQTDSITSKSSANPPKNETQQRLRSRTTAGLPSGPIKCCWCEHQMGSGCCQGWSTVVQMRQRHH